MAVLFAEQLLFLLVGLPLARRGGIGNRFFSDTTSTDKNLRLQQQLAFASFALHVVDGVRVLDVGVESKNHRIAKFCVLTRRPINEPLLKRT